MNNDEAIRRIREAVAPREQREQVTRAEFVRRLVARVERFEAEAAAHFHAPSSTNRIER
jgi:hypothetical protein